MSKPLFINTPIKRIGDVITGKTPQTAIPENFGTDYMFITPNELHTGYMVTKSEKGLSKRGFDSIKNNTIDGISVLVGCIGWDMGNVALCQDKCATNQQINAITNIREKYNPYYVYYWLKTKKDYLFKIASVTRTPILNKSTFENVLIPIPDRKVQDEIVSILSAIDEKIQLNNRIITELEEMAKTIYDYWFKQFDFPNSEGKPYKSSGGAMIWNGELKREIPNGWEKRTLETLVSITPNSFSPRKYGDNIVEHYSIPAYDEKRFPVFEPASKIASGKYIVEKDNILFSKLNPHFKRIWDPYCLSDMSVCSTEFIVYKCNKLNHRPFCFAVLNSDTFSQFAVSNSISSTGSRRRLTPEDTLQYVFVAPKDTKIIEDFCKFYEPILGKIKTNHIENHKLAILRDWILPMMMNEQVTLK